VSSGEDEDSFIGEMELIKLLGLVGDHCSSCHEDEWLGYAEMGTVDFQGREVSVCCLVRQAFERATGKVPL
jgi:hypothetical protein